MKKTLLWVMAGLVAMGASAGAQTYTIATVTPSVIAAGANGTTLTLTGTLPTSWATSGLGVCFYTAFGSTAPIVPTTGGSPTSVVVPASTIQQVPPSQFSQGNFNASVYIVQTPTVCNGQFTGTLTNSRSVTISVPSVNTLTVASVPQRNPNLAAAPPPVLLDITGTNFLPGITAVTLSGAAGSVSGTVKYFSPTLLNVVMPLALQGATSMVVGVCNQTATFTYCASPQTVSIYALAASKGILGAAGPASAVAIGAQFLRNGASGPTVAGTPSGTVTFQDGGATVGTGKLTLDVGSGTTFVSGPVTVTAAASSSLTFLADFNLDGLQDMLMIDPNAAAFHMFTGTAPYGGYAADAVTTPDAGCVNLINAAIGDLNGDGFPDVVMVCATGQGAIYADILLNNGDGTFGTPTVINGVPGMVALGDFNKDGKLDAVFTGQLPNLASVIYGFALYTGNGDGTFTAGATSTTTIGSPGNAIFMADLNNDGYPDLVMLRTVAQSQEFADVYQNDRAGHFGTLANGTYSATASVTLATYPNLVFKISLVALDGGAYPDIVGAVIGIAPGYLVAKNAQTGTIGFGAATTTAVAGIAQLAVGDFNGDGLPDLAVYNNQRVYVLTGDGKGNFSATINTLSANAFNATLLGAADVNADGYADAVVYSFASTGNTISELITSGAANAQITVPLGGGIHSLTAVWPGNFSMTGSTGSTVYNVPLAATSTTLTSSGTPTEFGQGVTLTATSAPQSQGAVPTGTTLFFDGAAQIGTGTLNASGVATFTTTALTAGSHSITAAYQGSGSYQGSTSAAVTQVVTSANTNVAWTPSPASIVYGTPLGGGQLDATASSKYVASVAGTFTYVPAAGTVLGVGTQTLNVTFAPTDTADFKSSTGATSVTVTQATPTIVWATPASIPYGTALSGTQLNASATGVGAVTLQGTFVYSPTAGTVLGVGPQTLNVTFTPTDPNYKPTTGQVTLQVTKGQPTASVVSSVNPSQFGQSVTLTATVTPPAGATAALTGNVNFMEGAVVLGTGVVGASGPTTASISTLTAGAHNITAVYSGDTNYLTATSAAVAQVVTQAQPVVTWVPSPASIVYGTALGGGQLDATAASTFVSSVAGTFAYTPAAGTVLTVGTQTLNVTFTPTDTVDFKTATGTASITVTKFTPVIAWAQPAAIVQGTALSATQLNATATGAGGAALPGTFVYTPAAGTTLAAGTQTLNVTFTPTDTVDYATATGTTTLQVISFSLTSVAPNTALLGDAAKTITVTGTGFVANSVVKVSGTAVATTFVNGTTLTAVIPASNFLAVGTLPITVFNPTQSLTSTVVNITVSAPPFSGSLTGPGTSTPGSQPTLTFTVTPYPAPLTGVLTLTFAPASGLTDDPNIQFAAGGRTLTFNLAAGATNVPTVQLQAGTVAGTITVTLVLTAGGVNVTPASIVPVVIVEAAALPSATSVSATRSGNTLTVVVNGFSNTREISSAVFHFTAAAGKSIDNPDITIPVGTTLFAPFYLTPGSQAVGSAFLYTQNFTLDQDAGVVSAVSVKMVNSVGTSAAGSTP